jgi:HSP20 family protein
MTTDLDVQTGDVRNGDARNRARPALWDWFDGDVGRFFERLGWPATWGEDRIRVEEEMVDGALVIRAEIPGVDPDKDVDISLGDGYLTIRAERRSERSDKQGGGFRTELRYGSFSRVLRLPEGAKADDVTASYTDGMLEVRVPMPPAATSTPQKVAVTRG